MRGRLYTNDGKSEEAYGFEVVTSAITTRLQVGYKSEVVNIVACIIWGKDDEIDLASSFSRLDGLLSLSGEGEVKSLGETASGTLSASYTINRVFKRDI